MKEKEHSQVLKVNLKPSFLPLILNSWLPFIVFDVFSSYLSFIHCIAYCNSMLFSS